MTNYKSKYLSLLISLKPELENILFNFDNINVNDLKIELYSDIKKYNELISTFKIDFMEKTKKVELPIQ